jgi:hypothetical protein
MHKKRTIKWLLTEVCFLIIPFCYLNAQVWPIIYGDNFHSLIKDISETYDKGFMLTAYTYDNSGVPEYGWMIKVDINGNILWDRKFGDGNYRNYFSSSKSTLDKGFIITGSTSKYSSGDNDPVFIKTDVCGNIEWCQVLKSPDQNYGSDILQIAEGSYIGALTYYGEGSQYSRISLIKLDQLGEPVWIQRLAQEDTLIYNEEVYSLFLTSDSNYLIAGNAYHPSSYPFWIMTDTSGVQVWDLFWNSLVGQAHKVVEKDTGIFYSTSWGIGSNRPQSPVLLKFDRYGNPIDMYFLMGDTIGGGSAYSISLLNDTNLLVGIAWKNTTFPAQEFSEVFLTDTLGNLLKRRFLLNDFHVPTCIIKTSDEKIVVSGSYVVDGNWDIYLWKMNSDLEDDTLYTLPLTYDSLCPYQILSDTVDLACSLFVKIDEIPTKEEYESTIKISPNPAREWVSFTLPENVSSGTIEIAIYNIFGQEVIKTRVRPQNRMFSLNISNLSSGIYLTTCKDSKNRILKGKIIVTR